MAADKLWSMEDVAELVDAAAPKPGRLSLQKAGPSRGVMDTNPSYQWLADIVLINESRIEAVAGDVSLYRSVGEACRALEHWWVEGDYGYAFAASGDRLILAVDKSKNVILQRREASIDGTAIVLRWLESSARSVLNARKARAAERRPIPGSYPILGSYEEDECFAFNR